MANILANNHGGNSTAAGGNIANLMAFMRKTNPDAARAQIEQMMKSGQLDEQRFNSLLVQARDIGNMLGIK